MGERNSVSGSDWVWFPTRLAIYHRDGDRCLACGSRRRLSLDHVKPRRRGGSNRPTNLVTLCMRCNRMRGAQLVVDWRPELVRVFRSAVRRKLDRAEGRRRAHELRPGRLEAKRVRDARRSLTPEQRHPELVGVPF